MNDIQYQFVKKILSSSSHSAKEVGRAFAPSNIALCKYWGKRDEVLNLPFNSSISISLGNKGSFTEIKRSNKDTFFLNDKIIDNETAFSCRLSKFLDLSPFPVITVILLIFFTEDFLIKLSIT